MRLRDVLLALTLAGCGSVSDNGNMPDAPPDAPDTAAPMIIDSHPGKDSKGVSVIQPITIVVDEALDAATVTSANIKVRATSKWALTELLFGGGNYENTFTIEGTATYDAATRKVTFTPLQPLPYNSRVEVSINGVTDAAGNALMTKLAFDTTINADAMTTFYTTNNETSQIYDFGLGMNGLQTKFTRTSAPGTDTMWLTSDDPATQHFDNVYDMAGRFTVAHSFQTGTDGLWYTPDDVESAALITMYDMEGRITSQTSTNAVGADGMWGTPDDTPSSYFGTTWMGDNFISTISYNAPGNDGTWRTDDDLMFSATATFLKFQYDSMNHRTRQVTYQPGADRRTGTPDDVIIRYLDLTTDAHGYVTRSVEKNAGGNGTWFDSDDAVLDYTVTTRDARGLATEVKLYDTAGSNGTWLDGDDHVSTSVGSRHTMTYNAAGQITEDDAWAAGIDGIMGTADDVISSYMVTKYDGNGARISFTSYSAMGPDNMWKTSDDQMAFRRVYGSR